MRGKSIGAPYAIASSGKTVTVTDLIKFFFVKIAKSFEMKNVAFQTNRQARKLVVTILSLASTGLPKSLLASAGDVALPPLTTCKSVHHLTVIEANRHFQVRLRATVTYYGVGNQKYGPSLFVTDKSGSVFVALTAEPAIPLIAGDVVEVTGISSGGDYAPVVAQGKTRVIGRSGLPAIAPRVGLESMMSGEQEGQWVEIEAVVRSVHASEGEITLDLAMRGGGAILARTPVVPDVDYTQLVDATVLVRGNAAPSFNHQGQITGGKVLFPGMEALKIEKAAPVDPFALPIQPAGTVMQYSPKNELQHRVHLRGAVTLQWPDHLLCVDDGGKGICAQIKQSEPVRLDELVDIVGFPTVDELTPILVHAAYRPAKQRFTIPVQEITTTQALGGRYDERLVSIEANVISEDKVANDPTIVLSSGAVLFTAVLPKVLAGEIFESPEMGSRIRLTGICSVQTDSAADPTGSGFPVAKSFRILLRSPNDIVVLAKPSWWNAAHTLGVLALALILALIALCRVVLLSRRIAQQAGVIRTQLLQSAALKDAAEFLAAHDELTGILNRRTIFDVLKKEHVAAAVSGNAIGVIMLDLDHFKHVNDTYGHFAGDEILRETVRRITLTVRSSDMVGRYGGEEFLIVLPRCDKLGLQTCGENIRAAIASNPMLFGNVAISMTTSVGTAITMSPPKPMLETLAAADSALYHAKHGGRNRVVLKDLATGKFENFLMNATGEVQPVL